MAPLGNSNLSPIVRMQLPRPVPDQEKSDDLNHEELLYCTNRRGNQPLAKASQRAGTAAHLLLLTSGNPATAGTPEILQQDRATPIPERERGITGENASRPRSGTTCLDQDRDLRGPSGPPVPILRHVWASRNIGSLCDQNVPRLRESATARR